MGVENLEEAAKKKVKVELKRDGSAGGETLRVRRRALLHVRPEPVTRERDAEEDRGHGVQPRRARAAEGAVAVDRADDIRRSARPRDLARSRRGWGTVVISTLEREERERQVYYDYIISVLDAIVDMLHERGLLVRFGEIYVGGEELAEGA